MKNTLAIILLAAAGTMQLWGADISGNWKLTMKNGRREGTFQLVLRQDGSSLSGTVAGSRREYSIAKGSVDQNNKIEIVLGGDGPLAGSRITGTAAGDRMRLTMQTRRGQVGGTAEKVQ